MSTLTTVEVLRGAKTVLERNGWTKGNFYDHQQAYQRTPPELCRVCLVGALNVATYGRPDEGVSAAERLLEQMLRTRGALSIRSSIAVWNDSPNRTLAEVYALLDEAIERAEAVSGS